MRSSALRHSNLSREKLAVIEALSRYRQDDESPNIYVRPNKEKELDMLWESFRVNQKSDKSPNVYLATGFIAGAVVTLILAAILTLGARAIDNGVKQVKAKPPIPAKKERKTLNLNFIPSSGPAAESVQPGPADAVMSASEIYTVAEGDTIEAILIRYYGSYSLEKQELIVEANHLSSPDKLSIGQKLVIPILH